MRKTEFADMLVREGIYSTRTQALGAMDAGKVHMQNVVFEDLPHEFPLLDAYLRQREALQAEQISAMKSKGFKHMTARSAVLMDDDDSSNVLWPNGTFPWYFTAGQTRMSARGAEGAYESLVPGKWVKDYPGQWLQFIEINNVPGEGCVAITVKSPKDHKGPPDVRRVPWETIIYFA